jgi:mRNA interferase MazF
MWWCEVPEIARCPVVVLSRDAAIPRLRRALIGPCTTTVRGIPTEVLLESTQEPIPRTSVVNLVQSKASRSERS